MNSVELIVRLIIKRGSTILLCADKENTHYFLPGGHVEFGDTLKQTIYKEMNEELGLKIEQIFDISYNTFVEQMYINHEKKHHELCMIFNANISENVEPVSLEDHIYFKWIDKNDIKNINLLPKAVVPLLFE